MPATPQSIAAYLSTARRRLRTNELRRVGTIIVAWGIGSLGIVILLDHLFRFVTWQRWLAAVTLLATVVLARLATRNPDRQGRKLSDLFVARKLEQANPALHNSLVTAIQSDSALPTTETFKKEIDRALANLPRPPKSYYPLAIAAELILLGTYTATAPQSVAASALRATMPWRAIAPPSYTQIVHAYPTHRDRIVTHEPWQIFIDVAGYPPDTGSVFIRNEGGPWQRHPLNRQSESTTRFYCTLPPVSGNWHFRAQIGDAHLSQRQVEIVQRPVLLNLKQRLTFPAYLEQPSRKLSQLPIQAVVGTQISLDFELDRNVAAASLKWGNTTRTLQPVGRHVRTKKPITVETSGTWHLQYKLHESDEWLEGERANITAIPDNLPTAELVQPTNDVEVAADSLVDIEYRGQDDFRVHNPELIIRRYGTDETRKIPCPESALPDRAEGTWSFNPSDLHAKPGDRFTVAFRVRDGHPAHLPGWSEAITITISAPEAPPLTADSAPPSDGAPQSTDKNQNGPQASPTTDTVPPPKSADSADPPKKPDEKQAEGKQPEATVPEKVAAAKDDNKKLANPGDTNQPSKKTAEASENKQPPTEKNSKKEPQQANSKEKPNDECEACKNPSAKENCSACNGGGNKPGDKPGEGSGKGSGGQVAQKAQSEQGQEGPKPEATPDPNSVAENQPKPDDKNATNQPPTAPKVGGGKGDSDTGAELPGDPNGNPNTEKRAVESTPKPELIPEGDLQAQKDPATEISDSTTPFDPLQQTDNQAALESETAPIQPDTTDPKAPTPVETVEDRELETFEADAPSMKNAVGETKRKHAPDAKSPGFAPANFSADDLDLIQSFREAANRLIRKSQTKK